MSPSGWRLLRKQDASRSRGGAGWVLESVNITVPIVLAGVGNPIFRPTGANETPRAGMALGTHPPRPFEALKFTVPRY